MMHGCHASTLERSRLALPRCGSLRSAFVPDLKDKVSADRTPSHRLMGYTSFLIVPILISELISKWISANIFATWRGAGNMASRNAPQDLSWLRKISIHLWALSRLVRTLVRFLSQSRASDTPALHSQLTGEIVRNFLEIGDALLEQPPRGAPGSWRRAVWLYFRVFYLTQIVAFTGMFARQWTTELSSSELQRIIHFGETAIEFFEAGVKQRVFQVPSHGLRAALMPDWQKVQLQRTANRRQLVLHSTLAQAYFRLDVGDTARNFDRAFSHYEAAARLLEQGGSFWAAQSWLTLGEALLEYPTECRDTYASKAVDALNRDWTFSRNMKAHVRGDLRKWWRPLL